MDNKKQENSRRQFFSLFLKSNEKIKMLTPDGKLVEVDKAIVEAASKNQKASNQEIYNWMDNPSKKKS